MVAQLMEQISEFWSVAENENENGKEPSELVDSGLSGTLIKLRSKSCWATAGSNKCKKQRAINLIRHQFSLTVLLSY